MNINRIMVLYLTAYAVAILVRSAWRLLWRHLVRISNTTDQR